MGDLWPGLLLLLLQTARGHRVRDPGRKEGPSGAAWAPSRRRTDPSRAGRRHLEEAVPRVRRAGTGSHYILVRLSEGAAEAVRPGQTEGDRYLAASLLPSPLPSEEFPWRA